MPFSVSTDYFALFPLVIFAIVIAIFVRFYRRKDQLHAAELGKKPLFSDTCGGVVGWLNYKGPFIRVAVYPDFVVVSCDRQYYLPFGEIASIERRSFLFTKGYRIHHRNPQYPKRIEVWLGKQESFEAALAGKVTLV